MRTPIQMLCVVPFFTISGGILKKMGPASTFRAKSLKIVKERRFRGIQRLTSSRCNAADRAELVFTHGPRKVAGMVYEL